MSPVLPVFPVMSPSFYSFIPFPFYSYFPFNPVIFPLYFSYIVEIQNIFEFLRVHSSSMYLTIKC